MRLACSGACRADAACWQQIGELNWELGTGNEVSGLLWPTYFVYVPKPLVSLLPSYAIIPDRSH